MEFYEPITSYQLAKKYYDTKITWETFYGRLLSTDLPRVAHDQMVVEANWLREKCPYYKVFPKIVECLI